MKSRVLSATWLCGLGSLTLLAGCQPLLQEAPGQAARRQAAGLGLDGDRTVTAPLTLVNRYAVLGADARRGDTSLTLVRTPGRGVDALLPLVASDLLLIHQAQGAELDAGNTPSYGAVTDLRSAGRYELISVESVDPAAGTIAVSAGCGGLKNDYQAAGHVQIVRVPQFRSLTIESGASLAAPPWDGELGGVIALQVSDTVTIDGKIDATGLGFRGGARSTIGVLRAPGVGSFYRSMSSLDGGNRGEGIGGSASDYAASGAYGRGAAANGGGGGNRINAGGGGGGNGGDLLAWNGQGVMSTTLPGGEAAWPLDPGYDATRQSAAGGGRGGYTYSGAQLDPTTVGPDQASWLEDSRRERGGLGGRPVPNDPTARVFLGGGGGAGDDYMSQSGAGGRGGGLIFIDADRINGSGSVVADGEAGGPARSDSSGAGGGGAGGSVILAAVRGIEGITISASGGDGGAHKGMADSASGPGGGGGGGYISTAPGVQVSRSVEGGPAGTSDSKTMAAFPANGASSGAAGVIADTAVGPYGGAPYCSVADLAVALIASPAQASGLDPLTLRLSVQNLGPSYTGNLLVRLSLPPLVRLIDTRTQDFACQPSGQDVLCRLANLPVGPAPAIDVTVQPAQGESTMTFDATVSAPSSDTVPDNNRATLTVQNTQPLFARPAGGGLSCAATGAGPGGAGLGGVLLAALALLHRRRRGSEQGA
jgi:hypothetical protein